MVVPVSRRGKQSPMPRRFLATDRAAFLLDGQLPRGQRYRSPRRGEPRDYAGGRSRIDLRALEPRRAFQVVLAPRRGVREQVHVLLVGKHAVALPSRPLSQNAYADEVTDQGICRWLGDTKEGLHLLRR